MAEITTLERLDEFLSEWGKFVAGMSENIVDLEGLLSYKLYEKLVDRDRLVGDSRLRLIPAIEAFTRVVSCFSFIELALEEAKAKRLADRKPNRQGIAAIVDILEGDNIVVEQRDVPLKDRKLGQGSRIEVKKSAAQIRREAEADYDKAKKPLFDAQEAMLAKSKAIQKVEADAAAVKAKFEQAGQAGAEEIVILQTRVDALSPKLGNDPLGFPADPKPSVQTYFDQAQRKLTQLEEQARARRSALANEVRGARALLEELRAVRVRALEAYKDAEKEQGNANGLATVGSTKEFADQLTAVELLLHEQKWQELATGWAAWKATLQELKGSFERAATANEQVLQRLTQGKQAAEREEREMTEAVHAARVRFEQLKAERVRCLELYQRLDATIEHPEGVPKPGSSKQLNDDLNVLQTAVNEKRWDDIHRLLPAWNSACTQMESLVAQAIETNQEILTRKDDLVRRWQAALQRTTEFEGKGLVVGKALTNFRQQAEQAQSGKVKLHELEDAIKAYETRLEGEIAHLNKA